MTAAAANGGAELRDRRIRRVIVIEGLANAAVLVLKIVVGVATGSLAVLSDAAHSLTDIANNVVAWFVLRLSAEPPDREHPYGHRKFETLAVFALATLLTVIAVQFVLRAFERRNAVIESEPWTLALMAVVLSVNIAVATWENFMARRLESDILAADARHTFADVATTVVVIVGWQIAARGRPWLDSACALGVAALILFLAYGLFRRAIPVLVDRAPLDAGAVADVAGSVGNVSGVARVRSRSIGSEVAVDLVIRVAAELSTAESHAIADEVENRVRSLPGVVDVTVHVEPVSAK